MVAVVLTDLPVASSAADGDITHLRKGLTDYQCAVSLIRAIDISSFTDLPTSQPTDNFLIGRGTSNYKIAFNRVSFPKSTKMWFYQANPPAGWTPIKGLGDTLLGVWDPVNNVKYSGKSGGTNGGTWQQTGATLTALQIPNHNHWGQFGRSQSNSNARYIHPAANVPEGGDPKYGQLTTLGMVGGKGDSATHDTYGGCDSHDHGATWRPKAQIGCIGTKDN